VSHGVKFTQSIIEEVRSEERDFLERDFLNVYFIVILIFNLECVAGTQCLKILIEYLYPCKKKSTIWICLLVPKMFVFELENTI
jgi:hypothetical protein